MFENPIKSQKYFPKILDLKSSSEQIFSKNWRWVPLNRHGAIIGKYARVENSGHRIKNTVVSFVICY